MQKNAEDHSSIMQLYASQQSSLCRIDESNDNVMSRTAMVILFMTCLHWARMILAQSIGLVLSSLLGYSCSHDRHWYQKLAVEGQEVTPDMCHRQPSLPVCLLGWIQIQSGWTVCGAFLRSFLQPSKQYSSSKVLGLLA